MTKKKSALTKAPRTVVCPVEKLAIEVGELWDAFNGAQAEGDDDEVERQLQEQRAALEEVASFRRAKSLGGAVFQLMLLKGEVADIFSHLSKEQQEENRHTRDMTERLLESAVAAICDVMGEDFQPLESVARVYIGDTVPIPWLDSIPELALRGRLAVLAKKSEEASHATS